MSTITKSSENSRCRLCSHSKPYLASIFRRNISVKIMELADIEVMESDGLPTVVCIECENSVERCYNFRSQVQWADKMFREELLDSMLEVEECNIKEEHGSFMEDEECGTFHSDDDHHDADDASYTENTQQKVQDEPVIPMNHVEIMETHEPVNEDRMIDDPQGQAEPLIEVPVAVKEEERLFDPLICKTEEDLSMEANNSIATQNLAPSTLVKRTVPASSLKISTTHNGSKNKSRLETFLQMDQNHSTVHTDSAQNSPPNVDWAVSRSEQARVGSDINNDSVTSDVGKAFSDGLKKGKINTATNGSFCEICYVECGSVELLQDHLEMKQLICRVCTAEFSSHKELEHHFSAHKQYNCKVCRERFSDRKSLLDHRKTSDGCNYEEECEICGKKFFGKLYLKKHKLIFHSEKSYDTYKCVVCGNGFVYLHKLNHHLQNCHSAYVQVECSTCHNWYLGPEKLKTHVRAAHLDCNKDEFPCSICGKRLTSIQNLKRHTESHDVTECLCDICGKSIRGNSAMKRHMKYEHSRTGKFICKRCNVQFDMEVKLLRHRKKVHRVIPVPAVCEMCGKEYKSKAILKKHKLTHFDEKPFECEICGASFKQESTLSTHKRVHNGECKFKCNNCEKSFKWKHGLARHAKHCQGGD